MWLEPTLKPSVSDLNSTMIMKQNIRTSKNTAWMTLIYIYLKPPIQSFSLLSQHDVAAEKNQKKPVGFNLLTHKAQTMCFSDQS